MDKKELDLILEKHKKWLNDENDGERANLRGANLRGADLQDADLQDADLQDANLQDADLRGANLRYANLRGANLRYANLRYADLRSADLRDANLQGADLDYSCWPLWCGSLGVHIDDRLAKQLLYHLLRNAAYSKNISEEVKNALLKPEIVALANEFHRTDECGKIEAIRKEEK